MDASYTGNKILQLRKQKNITQKELAELLSVTDKAVSKWERGLNFPDLLTMEKIAQIFDTSVVELLGIEDYSNRQVASEITDLANSEKQTLLKIIRSRGWQTIIVGTFVYLNLIYFSKLLYDRHINDVPVLSVSVWIGLIISNGIISVNYANRLLGKQTFISKFWGYFRKSKFYGVCNRCTIKIGDVLLKIAEKSPINIIIDKFFDKN